MWFLLPSALHIQMWSLQLVEMWWKQSEVKVRMMLRYTHSVPTFVSMFVCRSCRCLYYFLYSYGWSLLKSLLTILILIWRFWASHENFEDLNPHGIIYKTYDSHAIFCVFRQKNCYRHTTSYFLEQRSCPTNMYTCCKGEVWYTERCISKYSFCYSPRIVQVLRLKWWGFGGVHLYQSSLDSQNWRHKWGVVDNK